MTIFRWFCDIFKCIVVFRCKIPGLDNDTFEIQSPQHQAYINQTIPLSDDPTLTYDRCHVYDVYNATSNYGNATLRQCTEWVYDKSVFTETFTSKVCYRALQWM